MHVRLTPEVIRTLHELREQGTAIRQVIEGLQQNPTPADVLAINDRPDRYELFSNGYWIVYEIDRSGPETVVRVITIEAN
jgi:hypothetical protein